MGGSGQEQKTKTKTTQYRLVLSIILLALIIVTAGFIVYSRSKEQQLRETLATLNASEDKLQTLIKDSANLLGASLSNKLLYLEHNTHRRCSQSTGSFDESRIYATCRSAQHRNLLKECTDDDNRNLRSIIDAENSTRQSSKHRRRKIPEKFDKRTCQLFKERDSATRNT